MDQHSSGMSGSNSNFVTIKPLAVFDATKNSFSCPSVLDCMAEKLSQLLSIHDQTNPEARPAQPSSALDHYRVRRRFAIPISAHSADMTTRSNKEIEAHKQWRIGMIVGLFVMFTIILLSMSYFTKGWRQVRRPRRSRDIEAPAIEDETISAPPHEYTPLTRPAHVHRTVCYFPIPAAPIRAVMPPSQGQRTRQRQLSSPTSKHPSSASADPPVELSEKIDDGCGGHWREPESARVPASTSASASASASTSKSQTFSLQAGSDALLPKLQTGSLTGRSTRASADGIATASGLGLSCEEEQGEGELMCDEERAMDGYEAEFGRVFERYIVWKW